ncbi:hypothetical protein HFO97_27160 [Rhizobium leguminosarum]|uniref:hypothetical protein n=1 Tax=Rhizobium leguminosarum TaxID=384 RepID=UPI001C93825D|nr:hypothetical protein [Rhizobium leguminosarum]MBY5363562.1 hypothetical protein [Rhizobium leguminosarum]
MVSLQRIYGEAVHKNFSTQYGNFPPDKPVGIGDYGLFPDRTFHKLGELSDSFGITLKPGKPSTSSYVEFKSKSGVIVATHLAGDAHIGEVGKIGRAKIAFSKARGIFFCAAGCRTQALRDERALHRHILSLFTKNEWNPAWVVVTGAITSEAFTLVTSADGGAEIELGTDVDGPFDFADLRVSASLKVIRESGIGMKWIGQSGTPLLHLAGLRRKYWVAGDYQVKIRFAAEEPAEDLFALRDSILQSGGRVEDQVDFGAIDVVDRGT